MTPSFERVAILMVSHGGWPLLERSLTTLEELGALERVVLVDNASPDATPDRVRDQFPEVRLVEPGENLGFGAANNLAAREAAARYSTSKSEFFLLLNSDAWPESGAVDDLIATLDQDSDAAVACPRLSYLDGSPQFHWAPWTSVGGEGVQKLRNPFERVTALAPFVHHPWPGRGWFTAACLLVRRSAFEAVGGFDERYFLYFEDVDLCRRLVEAGWHLRDVPSAHAVHAKGGSQDGRSVSAAYRQSQRLYYETWRPRWEQRFMARKHSGHMSGTRPGPRPGSSRQPRA